jgi:hypothetical protein
MSEDQPLAGSVIRFDLGLHGATRKNWADACEDMQQVGADLDGLPQCLAGRKRAMEPIVGQFLEAWKPFEAIMDVFRKTMGDLAEQRLPDMGWMQHQLTETEENSRKAAGSWGGDHHH